MTPVLNPQRVLYIDNDPENRDFFAAEFKKVGFAVETTDDLETAAPFLSEANRFDVIIVDIELSKSQRSGFLDQMHELVASGTRPLICLLMSPSLISREEVYALGADVVLSKPIEPERLINRIRRLLMPEKIRWKKTHAPLSKENVGRERKIALSIQRIDLGRGGFSLAIGKEAEVSLLEGDRVNFSMTSEEKTEINGTGIVRYVRLDQETKEQKAWGIEFETLEEQSLDEVLGKIESGKPKSFIPSSLH